METRRTTAPYLGTGWSFPPRFEQGSGPVMVSGSDDVGESLRILIATRLGERVMLPLYGTPLDVFQGVTATAKSNIQSQVREAIIRYEPRVNVVSVDLQVPEGGLEGEMLLNIEYEIPAVNSRANMVFPFYLSEGNLVRLPRGPEHKGTGR